MSNPLLFLDKDFMASELRRFHEETGFIPTYRTLMLYGFQKDFPKNPFPNPKYYKELFGSHREAIIYAGFEVEKINRLEKAKEAERLVKMSCNVKEDCSKKDWQAPIDFICVKGYRIDIKSSSLHVIRKKWQDKNKFYGLGFWHFNLKKKKDADYYICLGMNEDFNEILHVWRFKNNEEFSDKHAIVINFKYTDEYKKHEVDKTKCAKTLTRFSKKNSVYVSKGENN